LNSGNQGILRVDDEEAKMKLTESMPVPRCKRLQNKVTCSNAAVKARDAMAKKILLVEDNEQARILMRQIFTTQGYEMMEAVDGLTGLDMATVLMPDLILLDIQMPVMNGFELIRELRNTPELSRIKVIAVTSFGMKSDREKALEAGFDEFVTKPIDTRTFPELVREILSRDEQ